MKPMSAFTYLLPLFFLVFIFVSCDTDENPVGTLEEAVERIPDVRVIDGAENANINVRYDRNRSYFTVSVDNTSGLNGVYNAWCVQMDVSLQSGVEHPGTQLYATDGDKVLNQLSYIVNARNRYERELEGLSWREIQTAMWVILETRDYNLAAIAGRLPSSVEGYNESYVNEILNDVKTNGGDFEPGETDTRLIYYEVADNQNGVAEKLGTAMARMNDNGDDLTHQFPGHPWFTYLILEPTPSVKTHFLYVGNVTSTRVGTVRIWKNNDYLYVRFILDEGYQISKSDVHVDLELPFFDKLNDWVFGHYLSKATHTPHTTDYTHSIPWNPDWEGVTNLHIAAHADAYISPEE